MSSIGHVKRTKARHRDRRHQHSAYQEPLSGRVTRLDSCFVNAIEIGMLKNILAPELRANLERKKAILALRVWHKAGIVSRQLPSGF